MAALTKKPTITFAETYRSPGLKIARDYLPTMPHATGHTVAEAWITKAGRATVDGEAMEFQDVRVYLRKG